MVLVDISFVYTGGVVGGALSVAQGGTFSDGFASGMMTGLVSGAIAGGIAGYNSMPNAPSGDLYANVGTQGGPCVVYREVIAIKLVLIAIQFAEEILKNGLEFIDKLKKKNDPVEEKDGSNQVSSCGGVAT